MIVSLRLVLWVLATLSAGALHAMDPEECEHFLKRRKIDQTQETQEEQPSFLPNNFEQLPRETQNSILDSLNGHILLHLVATPARSSIINYLATATEISFTPFPGFSAWHLLNKLPDLAPHLQTLKITGMVDPNQDTLFTEDQFIELIERLPNLSTLIIPDNDLTSIAMVAIAQKLEKLEYLDVSKNFINKAGEGSDIPYAPGLAALATISTLHTLIIRHLEEDGGALSGDEHLRHLTNLRKLDISYNDISQDGEDCWARSIGKIPHIEELLINHADVYHEDFIKALLENSLAQSLRVVDLRDNPLTNEMIMLILERAINLEVLDIRNRDRERYEDQSPLSDATKQALEAWKNSKPGRDYFIDE